MQNNYYNSDQHGAYQCFQLGDLALTRGGVLPAASLAYSTHGELNKAGSNAILFPVMFSGTSGSLKHYIASGLALDPDKYFIVVPNQLGNGLSSAPHNTPAPNHKANFPQLAIADDVRAQKQLCDHLGITSIELVTGWSMGAQQTYEWAIRYPELVKRIAPIAGTAKCTPHNQLYVDVFCEALRSDPAWQEGEYQTSQQVSTGLKRLANVFALMGVCTEFYKQEQWRTIGFNSKAEFLTGFWQAWFAPMDPNALLTMADKWRYGDSSAAYGDDLSKALARITAKTKVIAFAHDMFFPVQDCRVESELIGHSELHILNSLWGHFTMMGLADQDFKQINQLLSDLLADK